MKLATIQSAARDGELVVVDRTLSRAVRTTQIAPNLQAALDNWASIAVQLEELYTRLNSDAVPDSFELPMRDLIAPLPRAYQFLDGSAYWHHMSVIREARGAAMPEGFFDQPLLYQGLSDRFLGPFEPLQLTHDEEFGVDFEAEVAVITDDVPMNVSATDALSHVQLLVLLSDWSLRKIIPPELARSFGFLQGKPVNSMGPVAVTPDELGEAWNGGFVSGRYVCKVRGELLGELDPGKDMAYTYGDLIAHASRTRDLGAGTIIGAGAIANEDRSHGCGCISERRAREQLGTGSAKTPFLRFGDIVELEMFDKHDVTIFGPMKTSLQFCN